MFKPQGQPLTKKQLESIAAIKQRDIDAAIADADESLRPFLEAENP